MCAGYAQQYTTNMTVFNHRVRIGWRRTLGLALIRTVFCHRYHHQRALAVKHRTRNGMLLTIKKKIDFHMGVCASMCVCVPAITSLS